MGCDIHYVVERKVNGKWLGIASDTPYNADTDAGRRNYRAFGQLANVRVDGNKGRQPNSIPSDASELSLYHIDYWEGDGHSHSYLSLREFCDAYLEADEISKNEKYDKPSIPKMWANSPWWPLFGLDLESRGDIEDYRVLFWFDN